MCLYTRNDKPYVSKKDIVVAKALIRENGNLLTPYQKAKVILNDKLIAKGNVQAKNSLPEKYSNYIVDGGFIHAIVKDLTCYKKDFFIIYKAIIPAGTPFYFGYNNDIAAKSLFITDNEITEEELNSYYHDAVNILFSNEREENNDGVRIGDVCLSDKRYIHIENYDDKQYNDDAIGVVGYFKHGKPVIIGLNEAEKRWANNYNYSSISRILSPQDAANDYDGKNHTSRLFEKYKDDLDDYPALKYCIEYETKGTKKGDWYFGALGEQRAVARNCLIVEYSFSKIKNAISYSTNWLWSSSEGKSNHAWYLYPSDGNVYGNGKYYSGRVRAFASF